MAHPQFETSCAIGAPLRMKTRKILVKSAKSEQVSGVLLTFGGKPQQQTGVKGFPGFWSNLLLSLNTESEQDPDVRGTVNTESVKREH